MSICEPDLCLPARYRARTGRTGEAPVFRQELELARQPDVYPFVAHLARGFECSAIVDLGARGVAQLAKLSDEFDIVGIGSGATIPAAHERCPHGEWVEWDFASVSALPSVDLARAAVVCSDILEHMLDPSPLLEALTRLADEATIAVVSTPARRPGEIGPPDDPAHVREWSLSELERLLETWGANGELAGLTLTTEGSLERQTSLVVLHGGDDGPAPGSFSAVAFVSTFNEADIVRSTIEHLVGEGIGVYIIDNWSTDGTWEIARSFLGRSLIGAERFPPEGPTAYFELRRLLGRVEGLAATIRANWFIHVDADERRKSPWPAVSLRDALWRVERRGFNAVDHTVLTFPPIDDGFPSGSDPERYFRHFEFGRNAGHFCQIKAWKRVAGRVDLATSAGHDVSFAGRRVFPFNFLSKHYPVRSQAHGERKIFAERRSRWSPRERAAGWHVQYDHLRPGHCFVRDRATLEPFNEDDFARRYLVERLTRVGITRPEWPSR
jgi:hypothetical protein